MGPKPVLMTRYDPTLKPINTHFLQSVSHLPQTQNHRMPDYSSVLILLAISLCGVGSVIVRAKDRLLSQNKINASFTEVDVNLGELGDVNLRGLAIHNSSVWIGGSAGFVMRLKGEGQMHGQVEAAKEYEFRDVAIFDEADIVMLGSGSKAR